jgi:hypothetical protein
MQRCGQALLFLGNWLIDQESRSEYEMLVAANNRVKKSGLDNVFVKHEYRSLRQCIRRWDAVG